MSAKKRTKSSKKPTKKVKHALSPIEKELLDCCKDRQPVLLYGKDDYDREELVKEIHSMNVGTDALLIPWEYQGDNESTKRIDGMRQELRKALNNLLSDVIRDKLYKKYKEEFSTYMLDWNDTPRTYKYDDWSHKSGQVVSDDLSKFEYKRIDSIGKIEGNLLNIKTCRNHNDIVYIRRQYKKSGTKELLKYKGTLFINNLRCKKEDTVDENGYVDLAVKIELLKKEVPNSQRGWLVFYTRDSSTLPPYFLEQFSEILLSDKAGASAEKKKNKNKKNNFDDVRLKISINDVNNLRNAIINIQISIDNVGFMELRLEDRIRPVLYVLADATKNGKGVDSNLVANNALRKAYAQVDEAKYKIVNAFKAHIGKKRAGLIIKVEHRIGKRLLIPKKNITITKAKNTS